jgi:hypothetical protein
LILAIDSYIPQTIMTKEAFIRLSLGVGGMKPNGGYHGVLAVGSTICALMHGFVDHPMSRYGDSVHWNYQ